MAESFSQSVQSFSHVRLFATPCTTALEASISNTSSQNWLKFMSVESVIPSNHLILCHPLFLPPSIFPSIRVISKESVSSLHQWPTYWSFSFNISSSNEHPGLISFRMDSLYLLSVQGTLKSLLQNHSSKASIIWCSAFFIAQLSHLYMTIGKNIALNRWSRNTWSNRQIWPWSTELSRAKVIEFCQENTLAIANTLFQQHKRRLYTLTSPDGQHQNQIDYIVCSQRWRSSIHSAKIRPGADCASDHKLLIPNSVLNWRK